MRESNGNAIGIRATPKGVHWAVVRGTKEAPEFVAADFAELPSNQDEAAALSACRREVTGLVQRFAPAKGWIRSREKGQVQQDPLMRRCRIEGVAIATLDHHGVETSIGALASMKAHARPDGPVTKQTRRKKGEPKVKPPKAEEIFDAPSYRGVDWSAYPKEQKEAIFGAVALLA